MSTRGTTRATWHWGLELAADQLDAVVDLAAEATLDTPSLNDRDDV